MSIDTVPARKQREAARRRAAAARAVDALRAYATERGGRYVLFGSFVTGCMHHDSDLDILVDLDAPEAAAWRFAEDVRAQHAIMPDLHDRAASRRDFVAHVRSTGLTLA